MSKIVETFQNIWKIEELRQRLLFTLFAIIVARIGAHITLPGVDFQVLQAFNKGVRRICLDCSTSSLAGHSPMLQFLLLV